MKRIAFGWDSIVSWRKSNSSSTDCTGDSEKYGAAAASDTGMRFGMPSRSRI